MKTLKKNQKKVYSTIQLLKDVISSPEKFTCDDDLLKALKSQSAIAQYTNHDRDIKSCSLNTLKVNSNHFLERGFISLDELRIKAKRSIDTSRINTALPKGNKQSIAGLKILTKELEIKLDTALRSNFLLIAIISELRARLKELTEHEGTIDEKRELYRYINRKIEAELSYTLNEDKSCP